MCYLSATETTFDEMIANAWYSVREFHIHLSGLQADGMVRDGLERAILQLTEFSTLPANASKVEIKNAIREHNVTPLPYILGESSKLKKRSSFSFRLDQDDSG